MQYRLATPADYPTLAAIAAANLRDAPAVIARGRGFITGRFDVATFPAFAANLGILLAQQGDDIAGFLCLWARGFAMRMPILRTMLDACQAVVFGGQRIGASRLFFYGPVGVAPEWQGHGAAKGLYASLMDTLALGFDTGVLFVDVANAMSMAVHKHGLGMTRVGVFEFGGRHYAILAFHCAG